MEMLVLIIQVYSDHTAVFTDLDKKNRKKKFSYFCLALTLSFPRTILYEKHNWSSKVGFCFHLLQNKLATFKKQSKEARNIFKKKIFGCSLIVDLICTSIAVCYTCKPDNHSRESQS